VQPARKKIVIIGATSAIAEDCARQWPAQAAYLLLVIRHLPRTIFKRMDI
jgi:short-subunit dehydrogenase